MRLAILLLSGLLAGACSAAGDRQVTADSPAATPIADAVPAPAAPAPRGPHAADSACADVRALAERTLGIALATDSAASFDAPRELGRWSGCRHTAHFAMSSDSVPSNLLHDALTAGGWRSDHDWGADGADGAEYAVVRAPVLCHFAFVIPESGDDQADEDSDTVARARAIPYQLEIRCTSPVPALPTSH